MPDPISVDASRDPKQSLHRWMPHAVMLLLLAGGGIWIATLLAPVLQALLIAAAVVAFTYPLLFLPLDRYLDRRMPRLRPDRRRYALAMCITIIVASAVAGLLLLVLWSAIGDLRTTLQTILALAMHDAAGVDRAITTVMGRIDGLLPIFPQLHLHDADVRTFLHQFFNDTAVGPAFFSYLVAGTGGLLAQAALVLVTMFYLYGQGPELMGMVGRLLPLRLAQIERLQQRYRALSIIILVGTLGRAAGQGLLIGVMGWMLGGYNPVLVAVLSTFICLLPIVGPAFAWLPLSSVLWSTGHIPSAIALALTATVGCWVINDLSDRFANTMLRAGLWLSFALFLCVVGGLVGDGLRGLILGPAAVLAVTVLVAIANEVYGLALDGLPVAVPDGLPDPPAAPDP
jgi:predicted PurR-regulated permease PerM